MYPQVQGQLSCGIRILRANPAPSKRPTWWVSDEKQEKEGTKVVGIGGLVTADWRMERGGINWKMDAPMKQEINRA